MKICLLFSIVIFFITINTAQQIEIDSSFDHHNAISSAFEMQDSSIVAVVTSVDENFEKYMLSLVKFNYIGDVVTHVKFEANNKRCFLNLIFELDSNLIFIGFIINEEVDSNFIWFVQTDLNLNIQSEKKSPVNIKFHPGGIFSVKRFEKKYYISSSGKNEDFNFPVDPFYIVLDQNGELLVEKFNFLQRSYITDILVESEQKIYLYGFGEILFLVDSTCNQNIIINNFQSTNRLTPEGNILLDDSLRIVLSGRIDLGVGIPNRDIGLKIYNADYTVNKQLFLGDRNNTHDQAGINRSLIKDKFGNYLIAGTSGISLLDPTTPTTPSWFYLAKVDKDLELSWEHFYGGNAYYHLHGLSKCIDESILLYGNKYDFNSEKSTNFYLIKVDSTGNYSSTINVNTKEDKYELWPNPVGGVLIIKNNTETNIKVELTIVNSLGAIIEKRLIDNNSELDVSMFIAGMYFYYIRDISGKLIQSSNFIKM